MDGQKEAIAVASVAQEHGAEVVSLGTIGTRQCASEKLLRHLQAATLRHNAFWLRHAIRSTGRATGSPAPLRWRSAVGCPTPAQPMVLQASLQTVTAQTARVQRLEHARREQGHTWRFPPVVAALQA